MNVDNPLTILFDTFLCCCENRNIVPINNMLHPSYGKNTAMTIVGKKKNVLTEMFGYDFFQN